MIEFLTAALVVITTVYACLTHRISKANQQVVQVMREQSDALNRPYVIVAAVTEPGSPNLYLRISNSGKTAAEKLRLKLDRDFYMWADKSLNLSGQHIFRHEIASFAPGAVLTFGLIQSFKLFGKDSDHKVTPLVFKVQATYRYLGNSVEEETIIDLQQFRGALIEESFGEKHPHETF